MPDEKMMMEAPSPDPADLDSIALSQALRDVEAANARVIDLTHRLLQSEQQRRALADELERLRLRVAGGPAAAAARSLRRVLGTAKRAARKVLLVREK